MGLLERKDLAKENMVTLKRWAKLLMVPAYKTRSEILDHIFANRKYVPYCPRRQRSLRVAATEKGIVKLNDIDRGKARTALKAIKGYNPHKDAISQKAREEVGPQSPVATDVGSPPRGRPSSLEPEVGSSSRRLDKDKGVDRGGDDEPVEAESPYPRPSRVPLGQLTAGRLAAQSLAFHSSLIPTSDIEDLDMRAGVRSRPLFGERGDGGGPGRIEDPARGRDSGTEYIYPPRDAQKTDWLDLMGWGLEEDAKRLEQEVQRIRELVNSIVIEGTLAMVELDEDRAMYHKLLGYVEHVGGAKCAEYILRLAEEIDVPEYVEDDYVDPDEMMPPEEEYDYEAEMRRERMAADTSRPSDAVSYADPSSPPPTSPLANASARAKRRREIDNDFDSAEAQDSPSAPKRSRHSGSNVAFRPNQPSPREQSPEIPFYDPRAVDNNPEPPSPRQSHRGSDDRLRPSNERHSSPGADDDSGADDDDDNDKENKDINGNAQDDEQASRSSRSRSADDSDDAASTGSRTPRSRRTPPPCQCKRCLKAWDPDAYVSEESDGWSDLVSPEAGLPPGWPDRMPAQYWYLKETTYWKTAMGRLRQERLLQAQTENPDPATAEAGGLVEEQPKEGEDGLRGGEPADITSGKDLPAVADEQANDSGSDVAEEYDADKEMLDDGGAADSQQQRPATVLVTPPTRRTRRTAWSGPTPRGIDGKPIRREESPLPLEDKTPWSPCTT
ncbi:hypothetical protein BD414DRAFT_167820 [Trametes punicea]|nr:hypothetical protein BD414DRAFT_167820 [Trametes punicea]